MKKGLSLLQVLFVVFMTLKLLTFQPFASWSTWVIFALLAIDVFIYVCRELWYNYGLGDSLRVEIDKIKYEKIILRREIRRAALENKKKIAARDFTNQKNKN